MHWGRCGLPLHRKRGWDVIGHIPNHNHQVVRSVQLTAISHLQCKNILLYDDNNCQTFFAVVVVKSQTHPFEFNDHRNNCSNNQVRNDVCSQKIATNSRWINDKFEPRWQFWLPNYFSFFLGRDERVGFNLLLQLYLQSNW